MMRIHDAMIIISSIVASILSVSVVSVFLESITIGIDY